MNQNTRSQNIRKIVMTGMLAAISTLLMFLDFSLPFMPYFLKFDISELPALFASFSISPLSGVIVCLIKNSINMLRTITGGVGELCNFLLGASFVLPAGLIYKHYRTKHAAIVSCIIGTISMGILSVPINYFIVYPIYIKIMPIDVIIGLYQEFIPSIDGLFACLVIFNLPLTIFKGLIDSLITFVLYKRLSPFVKGK